MIHSLQRLTCFQCSLLAGLRNLHTQVMVVIFIAGFVYPSWFTAFAADASGGSNLLWSFMIFERCRGMIFGSDCVRIGWGIANADAHDVSFEFKYHVFATLSIVQSPATLLIANLCVVFACQLGGWTSERVVRCSRRPGAKAISTSLASAATFLPLVPVTLLMSKMSAPTNFSLDVAINEARIAWMSIGMPVCFGAAVPLLCGLIVFWLGTRSSLNLFDKLHGTTNSDGSDTDDHDARGATVTLLSPGTPSDRFTGDAKDLVVGRPEAAATGIWKFIQADEHRVHAELLRGTACVIDEWERGFTNGSVGRADLENLRYVLSCPAGSSDTQFQNGWQRDRHPDTGALLEERMREDGSGMTLEDFAADPSALKADLTPSHILALRLYTTAAFKSINMPLRNLEVSSDASEPQLGRPHPLPCTVFLVYDGLKKLRAVHRRSRATVAISLSSESASPSVSSGADANAGATAAHSPITINKVRAPIFPRDQERSDELDVNEDSVVQEEVAETPNAGKMVQTSFEIESGAATPVKQVVVSKCWPKLTALLSRMQPTVISSQSPPEGNNGGSPDERKQEFLWRGIRNVRTTQQFLLHGGSELAPCSTTPDLKIAVRYAKDWQVCCGQIECNIALS